MHTYFNGQDPKFLYNQNMRIFQLCVFLLTICTAFAYAENDHVKISMQNAPAVVAINAVKDDTSTFTGTGFVLTPDGLIATSRHVVEHTLYMNVTFNNGAVSGEAVVVAVSDKVDLALLKIKAQNLSTVHVADSASVQPGQPVTVIGNPRRLQNTITSGIISQIRKKANGVLWHQISAPISPSSSGSPVFNEQGQVISVAFASYPGENNQNLNFSVPSSYLLELVQQAGFSLPQQDTSYDKNPSCTDNAFTCYLHKCWDTLNHLLHKQGPASK